MAIYRSGPFSRSIFLQRDFQLPGVRMFGHYQYSASYKGLLPHSHREGIEICFLERGEQTYRVHGTAYRLRGNDQFFTLPGEVHDSAGLPQERGNLYWLILRFGAGGFLGLAEAPARLLQRELLRLPSRHFQADAACGAVLKDIQNLLIRRGGRGKPGDRFFLRFRIQALLLQYLALTIRASHHASRRAVSPLMQRVLGEMELHLSDPVAVGRLATAARLSGSRFKARFKREFGLPPGEFWMRRKIARAETLLRTRSVTDVAHALGFSSSQYFATAFKRYTLKKPSQCRGRTGRSVSK